MQISTCKKVVQAKRNRTVAQVVSIDEDNTCNGPVAQSSSSYSSGDDSNTSQELNGGATSDSKGSVALNSGKKPRAGRGAATDPQSLYARVSDLRNMLFILLDGFFIIMKNMMRPFNGCLLLMCYCRREERR